MRTFVTLLCIGVCAIVLAGRGLQTSSSAEVTYYKDVAPLLEKHCIGCHRPDSIANMSLMTYDEVLPFACVSVARGAYTAHMRRVVLAGNTALGSRG
jgi:hypothetical protein